MRGDLGMNVGDLVVHDDGVRSGRVEGFRRACGRLWVRVRLDNCICPYSRSSELAACPIEEWHKADEKYSQ